MLVTPGGRGLGLRLDVPRDPRNWAYPVAPLTAPPPFAIDLSDRFPFPVQDQGQEGSCTAFAGTGLLEWLLNEGDTPGSDVKLSEAFTYYVNRREDGSSTSQDAGASSQSIAKGFAQFGAADELLMPYQAGDYATAPSTLAFQDALDRRILKYYEIRGDLLGGVWAALMGGIPVLMGFQVPESFETRVGSDGYVPQPRAGERIVGGHEGIPCGWRPDSGAPGGQGWVKFRNSWGERMGERGYYYIPTIYWQMGLVMDHMVLAFDVAPVPPTPQPEPDVDTEEIRARLDRIRECVVSAQAARCAWGASKATYQQSMAQIMDHEIGPIDDLARECQELLPKVDPPGPPPAQFVSPFPAGAIYGKTKWLFGSLGVDGFCKRGTYIVAPADMVIEEVIPGQGISGGAEIIAALPDKSWAWRWRHVQGIGVAVGQAVRQGQTFAYVLDTSLDMLCAPPVRGYPDSWQHWDFSVNKGTDRFSPQGGGGGNYSSYQWLTEIDYAGTLVAQTPGPPSCGMSTEEAIRLLTPAGRRK